MKHKGITLLELIIAISLLVLVIFAGSGIYLSGWRLFRDAQFIAQAQRNAMLPMMHMVKRLKRARVFSTGNLSLNFIANIYEFPSADMGRYEFDPINHQIIYQYGELPQVVWNHIAGFSYSISHGGIVATISITATDNNGNNPYTITSTVEARYGATPPVI